MTAPSEGVRPDLDAIERRAAQATPGPWAIREQESGRSSVTVVESLAYDDEQPGICGPHSSEWPLAEYDAVFMTHARSDIPALIAECRRLRAALEEIAASPHQSYEQYRCDGTDASTAYNTGCADGHRCAGNAARRALGGAP